MKKMTLNCSYNLVVVGHIFLENKIFHIASVKSKKSGVSDILSLTSKKRHFQIKEIIYSTLPKGGFSWKRGLFPN